MRQKVGQLFPVLAWTALVAALLAVVMGGVVRVTGSGLGCPDWPLCHGQVIPPANLGSWLEYTHRLTAIVAGLFIILTVVASFGRFRPGEPAHLIVLLVPILLVIQAVLGGITVLTELSSPVALAHTGVAAILVGVLALVAASSHQDDWWTTNSLNRPRARNLWWALAFLAFITFLTILSGSYVTRTGASLACTGLPLCGVSDFGAPQWAHMAHRGMSVIVFMGTIVTLGLAIALKNRGILMTIGLLSVVMGIQVGLGVTNVFLRLPAWSRGAHLALSIFFFAVQLFILGSLWRTLPLIRTKANRENRD